LLSEAERLLRELEVWCEIRPPPGALQTKPGSAVVRGA
jgi:hypothetical protein